MKFHYALPDHLLMTHENDPKHIPTKLRLIIIYYYRFPIVKCHLISLTVSNKPMKYRMYSQGKGDSPRRKRLRFNPIYELVNVIFYALILKILSLTVDICRRTEALKINISYNVYDELNDSFRSRISPGSILS